MRSARTAGVEDPPITKGRAPPRSHLTVGTPAPRRSPRLRLAAGNRHGAQVEIAVRFRLLVRAAEERIQLGRERDLAALHGTLGGRDHGIDPVFLERSGAPPHERWNVGGHELRAVEIAPDSYRGAGGEGRADPALREVPYL